MASTRPKGFMSNWKPKESQLETLRNVKEILATYRQYGPMTLRQIFYALAGDYQYPKTQLDYKRLGELLMRARRAGVISFGDIRDDSGQKAWNHGHEGRSDYWEYIKDEVENGVGYYNLDRQIGQPHHIELFCETEGMVPMLSQMVRKYNIPVISPKGFSSVTVNYQLAKRVSEREKPTYFLHVGDYDPSGESIFTSMSQDVGAFVTDMIGGRWNPETGEMFETDGWPEGEGPLFKPRRIALTWEQVVEFGLETAPANPKDTRSNNWVGETTQLEAFRPPQLEKVIIDFVEENLLDWSALEELEAQEERDKEIIRDLLSEERSYSGATLEAIVNELAAASEERE